MCNLLLSALGRIFTAFLQLHGFTLGVEDILIMSEVRILLLCSYDNFCCICYYRLTQREVISSRKEGYVVLKRQLKRLLLKTLKTLVLSMIKVLVLY